MTEEQLELFSMEPATKPGINYMDLDEFHKLGFLQEVNRQFFHPLGLALELIVDEGKAVKLGGIWDYREDEDGMVFGDHIDFVKAQNVAYERARHAMVRVEMFGSEVQPLGWEF